jgi:PAS domain S-box-containing protein
MDDKELSSLQTVATNLSWSIENARLYLDLRRAQRFRQDVLDSMSSCLLVVDKQSCVITANRVAERLIGMTEAELVERDVADVFSEKGSRIVSETLASGLEALREETTMMNKDGEEFPISLSVSALRDDEDHIYGAIAVFMDLTPVKQMEEKIRQLDRLAVLGTFASSVAHEIKNPLTGIATGIQYIGRSFGDGDPRKESLEFILEEIQRLDRTVNELFRVTHPPQLRPVPADIGDVIQRGIRVLSSQYQSKSVSIKTIFPETLPVFLFDPEQIEQVVINVLKNALEASPTGGTVAVEVDVDNIQTARFEQTLLVAISDQGNGIDAEHTSKICDPFFSTKENGSGLGLYVCREIIERHGGTLSFTSRKGTGSRFEIRIPRSTDKEN